MSSELPTALVLCGGLGTRLRTELALGQPKALADVNGRPFIERLLDHLRVSGFARAVLCAGYGYKALMSWYSGWQCPVNLSVVVTVGYPPRGTFQAVNNARTMVAEEEEFFVINGDTFCRMNYRELVAQHRAAKALATVAVDDGYKHVGTMLLSHGAFNLAQGSGGEIEDLFSSLGAKAADRVVWYFAEEPFYDIGTPEGLDKFRMLTNGKG